MTTVVEVGQADPPVLFDAILYPHRSLGRRGVRVLLALVAAVGATVGGFFYFSGAWPVFGFYGLDVAILGWALRRNLRDARIYEQVRLTDRALVVDKVDRKGVRRSWSFQPYWLRVSMDDPPEHDSQVTLSSHGQSLVVGSFLSPPERLDFARALRAALDRLRAPSPAPPTV